MAASAGWIVFVGENRVGVARTVRDSNETLNCQMQEGVSPDTAPSTIGRLLEEAGYRGEPILLALDSATCLAASLQLPSVRQARKRTALGYLLEAHLPWPVEEAVIDYELDGDRGFFVAIETRSIKSCVDALEVQGHSAVSITPLARLALAHHLEGDSATQSPYILLWRHGQALDCWLIENDRPLRWYWLPLDEESIAQAVGQLVLSHVTVDRLRGRNLPAESLEAIANRLGLKAEVLSKDGGDDPMLAAAQAGELILRGRRAAPIELRRDALASTDRNRAIRSHLRLAATAVVFLLATLGVSLLLQTQRTDKKQHAIAARQEALFGELFPGQPIPVAIGARLQSELARLKGIRGERGDLPPSVPYLGVLQRLLKSLPVGMRSRVLEMRIENGQLYLVGQVRLHGDADRVAEALRTAGFDVSPPNTHSLSKEGVEFRLSARMVLPSDKKGIPHKTLVGDRR